jgi:hypothetical protein
MATFTECIPEAAAIQQGKYAAYEGKSPLPPKGNGVRRTFYVPELDALRFCAFLMVFFRHITSQFGAIRSYAAGPSVAVMKSGLAPVSESTGHWAVIQGFTQSMDFGVCLFFFLSSFLITRLLLLERQAAGRIDVGKFYVRHSRGTGSLGDYSSVRSAKTAVVCPICSELGGGIAWMGQRFHSAFVECVRGGTVLRCLAMACTWWSNDDP